MATTLEDLIIYHDIAQVKYRYLRALDSHDWELMRSCFTPNARAWYSGGKYATEGRDAIVDLLAGLIPENSFIGSHIVTHPEFERLSETTVKGIWRLQDMVHFLDDRTAYENFDIKGGEEMVGAGYYYDRYEKVDGEWLISSTGYERIFEYCEPREGRPGFKLLVDPHLGVHQGDAA
jgi:hypothetical protein